MERQQNFTIRDLAAKWRSKTELYNLLSTEGGIYLPPKQDATQQYLRCLMMGKKKYLKWKDVTVIKVPQYKGLTVRNILRFADSKFHVTNYLPDYTYAKEPNREWVWNVINTIIPGDFQAFIEEKVNERKQYLIESQNLGISVLPEFQNIFKNSQAVSTVNGKSYFLARFPKVTKNQSKLQKLEEEKKEFESHTSTLTQEINELKLKMEEMQEKLNEFDENQDKLSKLYEMGIIDENAELINNDMK